MPPRYSLHVWESVSDIDILLQLSSVVAKVCNLSVRDNKDIQDSDISSSSAPPSPHSPLCAILILSTSANQTRTFLLSSTPPCPHTQRSRRWFVAYANWAFLALRSRSRSLVASCAQDVGTRQYWLYCCMGISTIFRITLLDVTLNGYAAYFRRCSVPPYMPYVQSRGCIARGFPG